jgi:hypothetical protein
VSGGANILVVNNQGQLLIHDAVFGEKPAVSKYLLREFYATICGSLPLHELLHDLTKPNRYVGPPLRFALQLNVLGMDDVVEIIE